MYKKMLWLLAVVLTCSFWAGSIWAQEKYPEKPIQAIVPYAAGSSTENAVRLLGEYLQKYWGQPVVVVNKPGAGGAIGGNELYKSKPDGYTVGMFNINTTTPELLMNPERFIYKSKDLQAVVQFTGNTPMIAVRNDAPWKTLPEFIEDARKNPNKYRWGHHGRGSPYWQIGTGLFQYAGIKVLDVPFEGDGKHLIALLGGHVDISVMTYAATNREQIKAKKIRALAVPAATRYDSLPDVPRVGEVGFPAQVIEIYIGVFVPKGTPQGVIDKWREGVKRAVGEPDFKERMDQIGFPVWYKDTKEFEEHVARIGKAQQDLLKQFGVI
jgi:tripartite-type tricarboxylate transporter receptor subunit TctC